MALGLAHIFSFRATGAFFDFKDHLLAFIQTLVTIHVDGRKMHEYVAAAFFVDEPIPLFVVEPFYGAVRQNITLLFQVRSFSIFSIYRKVTVGNW